MSKNWISIVTSLGLVLVAVILYVVRKSTLGPESAGPLGWKVRLVVEGILMSKDAGISVERPLDFRRQHVAEERFKSGKELREPVQWKRFGQRKNTWRRQMNTGGTKPFHLEYSFLCSLQRPSAAMERLTARLDAPPAAEAFLESTPRIEAKDKHIALEARKQATAGWPVPDQIRALADYVATLGDDSSSENQTALACLENGGGDALGKARLVVALCRSNRVPSRVVSGLVLESGSRQPHFWAEAWDGARWLPVDPTRADGTTTLPENYLVFRLGDGPLVIGRGAKIEITFAVQPRSNDADVTEDFSPSPAKAFWRKVSFYSLHVSEQHVVEFLLLLPLAALIVRVARTLIGITTFGIFGPALIGLAFLDLKALPWGLPIFVLTVLVGWGLRRLLEHFHLLQVPRVAAMLTLIVIFLLVMIVVASNLGITTTRYVSLFPLVILTFVVERFWTIEEEDSTAASFRILLGTIAVAVVVSLALGPPVVRQWMFRYPETLGVVLAAQLLLGRYTGYRLTELYRFGDLLKEPSPSAPPHGEDKP